jgi:hypothetical protein
LLDVIYFFPIVKTAFFDKSPHAAAADGGGIRNMEMQSSLYLFMIVPLIITAVFSIIFCFFPGTFYVLDLVEKAVDNLF